MNNLDPEILFAWLLVLLCCLVIVLDALSTLAAKKQKASGIVPKITSVLTPSSNFKDARKYVSKRQGLAGKPDALLVENGFIIPIERKPFTNKVRDRYVAQLLVYMRLIEEFEGKKPPYGYLVLGKTMRKVKVTNTEKRQIWLQSILDEMHAILSENQKAQATPQRQKCRCCKVREYCLEKA